MQIMSKPVIFRTVNTWVRYNPELREITDGYRYKYEAEKNQKVGEVIFDMKGFYAPGMIKKPPRKKK